MSLSSDGRVLAVGGPGDNDYVGATWIFVSYDDLTDQNSGNIAYQQLGTKLVGSDYSGESQQGKTRPTCIM